MVKLKKALAILTAAGMAASVGCSKTSSSAVSESGSGTSNENSSGTNTSGNDVTGQEAGQSGEYTYNIALSVFPTNWSPHQEQTSTDYDLMTLMQSGFYEFDYNEDGDSYALVDAAAIGDPEDITEDYVGQYGIEEGDSAQVYKITLRDDLKWEDGTAITAQDFVTSAELLLKPEAQNYRADSLYSGNLVIYNAKNYLYQGQHVYATPVIESFDESEYIETADFEKDDDGYYTVDGRDMAVIITQDLASWDGENSLEVYAEAGYFTEDYYTQLADMADDDGVVKVNDEVAEILTKIVAEMHVGVGATPEDYDEQNGQDGYAYIEWEEMCYYGEDYADMDFSEVGMFALSDTELVIALEKPLEGFYLKYSLSDSWLVNEELYESCESISDGIYSNTYGTSAETSISWGPYKLESFQQDKQYVLVKNDQYFGFTDDTYQTTRIVADYVAEQSTTLELFLNGDLDEYSLSADDMETYQSSDYTYYATGDSTFFVALNPDMDGLTEAQENMGDNYNKTILTVKEFRQALSFALDRSGFALASVPTNSPAFGIYSSVIIKDPETGETYRSTEQAKQVLADFWGLSDEIGEGKMYETLDDAIDSLTGYNLEQARELFDEAYDIAIEEGLMDEDDVISICIGLPATRPAYTNGAEFLENCYTEAVKGTKLEGKLEFTVDDTIGNDFATALQNNQVDLLFLVGWTGSALDPYSLMEAYTSSSYQYDPAWDTTTSYLDITLEDGKTYTASVWDWTTALSGTVITVTDEDGNELEFSAGSSDENAEERFDVLVALEGAVLETYDLLPLVDDASAQMRSMQINYYTEDYVFGMGFGGYKYITYNYDDAEWDEYVSSQGGTLNYK